MVKIKTSPYHYIMRARKGNKHQVCKALQEINELCCAYDTKDRDLIVEELADVILTYPYLRLGVAEQMATDLYAGEKTLTVDVVSPVFIACVRLFEKATFSKDLTMCIIYMSQLFLNSLNMLIKEYGISDNEINEIIEFKKSRTIRESFFKKKEAIV